MKGPHSCHHRNSISGILFGENCWVNASTQTLGLDATAPHCSLSLSGRHRFATDRRSACNSFHSMLFHCQFKSMHREKYVREKDLRTDANASQQNNVLQGMWPPAAHQQPERKLPPILRLLAEKAKDHRMGWRTNQDLQAEACIQSHNHCGHSQLRSKCLQACLKL